MASKSSPRRPHRLRAALLAVLIGYLAAVALPYVPHKEVSPAFTQALDARTFYGTGDGPERVATIDTAQDALLSRLQLIHRAQREIILSTFDFNTDQSGTDVLAALYQAASRGVQVRVLIDGGSGFLDVRGNALFQALDSHENAEIRIYNPVNLLAPHRLQARLHDKYLICDDTCYLLGGRNTSDLFLGDYTPEACSVDRELLVVRQTPAPDASIDQLRDYFTAVWALPATRPLSAAPPSDLAGLADTLDARYAALQRSLPAAFQPWDLIAHTLPAGRVSLLTNPIEPKNKQPWMWYALTQLMRQADTVSICTPYIICGSEMYRDLTQLTADGVQIEILINHISVGANPWGCADYLNEQETIRRTGVQIYERAGEQSVHTKLMVLDDRLSVVGSYNLDMRSTYQDTELMLVVDSPALNAHIRSQIAQDKAHSCTVDAQGQTVYGEAFGTPQTPLVKRILLTFLRLLVLPIRRFL